MRAPVFRGWSLLPGELVADNFAGGGGASTEALVLANCRETSRAA